MGSLRAFLTELRRRKVYHAAVVYAAVAFVVWQVADIALPALGLPAEAMRVVLALSVVGFPFTLVLAWAYELRPEEQVAPGSRDPPPGSVGAGGSGEVEAASVAVLPFRNMSAEPGDQHFADGVAEEIISVLAGLPHLHVAARTSAFAFKDRTADAREIGSRLNVAYLVEGGIRRSADTIRVTAQLVDVTTGFHLWSDRFDRPMGDIFAIQDEIAFAVARRLARHVGAPEGPAGSESGRADRVTGALSPPAPRPVARSPDLVSYESYLRGRQAMAGLEAPALLEAQRLFEAALEADPAFAAAHAGLAESLTLQAIGFRIRPETETMPRARDAAERALDLAPDLPEAHLTRGLVAMYYEWDHGRARRALDRALGLGPSVARVHFWREFYFTYVEADYAQAVEANRRAQELNPLDPGPRTREGTVRYLFGDLEEAERLYRAMLVGHPGRSLLHAGLADTLCRQGRTDEAISEMKLAVEFGGGTIAWLGILAGLQGLVGATAEARAVVRQLDARMEEGTGSHFWIAVARAGLGEMDAAFEALDKALRQRDSSLLYAFHVPRAMGLHRDPRFPGLLRQLNLGHLVPALSD